MNEQNMEDVDNSALQTFARDKSMKLLAGKRNIGRSKLMDIVQAEIESLGPCNIIRFDSVCNDPEHTYDEVRLESIIKENLRPDMTNYVLIVDIDATPHWDQVADRMSSQAEFIYTIQMCRQLQSCCRFTPSA